MRHQPISTLARLPRITFLATLVLATLLVPGLARAASYAGIVVDAKTGQVLYQERADARQHPASLTKMMTLYMVFEALDRRQLTKQTRITVSGYAAARPPSKLGIRPGSTLTVEQAILALVTKSANDVATAVGEHLGGTESRFGQMMTAKARALGMRNTTFANASGLTANGQLTTARDMATLGIALREHFPHHYGYFSTRSFTFGKHRMGNHNRLLGKVQGVDGIKTGYTRPAGFNLVTSAQAGGRSIVAVVLGGSSGRTRNAQMTKLVRAYLPKASRGADQMLVARAKSPARVPLPTVSPETPVVVASTNQLAFAPEVEPRQTARIAKSDIAIVPSRRPAVQADADSGTAEDRIASAHGAEAPRLNTRLVASIERKLMTVQPMRVPVPSPAATIDRESTGSTRAAPAARPAPAPAPSQTAASDDTLGWQIQIGATPTADGATDLLSGARGKAKRSLAGAQDYLEPVESGGATLYRARFAGFASKDDARSACAALKKARQACLVVNF